MKNSISFISALLLSTLLTNCSPTTDTDPTPPPNVPMVQTEEIKITRQGVVAENWKHTYTYDNDKRVTNIQTQNLLTNAISNRAFNYSQAGRVLEGNIVYELNAAGLAITKRNDAAIIANYTYDANGFLTNSYGNTTRTDFTIQANNVSEERNFLNNTLTRHEQLSYAAALSTIGNYNKGMRFLGKSSEKLVATRSTITGQPMYIYNFTNTLDNQNRVVTYGYNRTGGNQAEKWEAFYTYY